MSQRIGRGYDVANGSQKKYEQGWENIFKFNLCDHCLSYSEFPVCMPDNITFGNGKENDNIISCSNYEKK